MQTMRLRAIREPSQVERLLESFIQRLLERLQESHHRVLDTASLSAGLRLVAQRARAEGLAWAAWTSAVRTWLFTAELCFERSRESGRPVLVINIYDETGRLRQGGAWLQDRAGSWQRCQE